MKNDIETGFAIRTDQHTFSINDQPEGRIVKPQKGLRIKPDDIVVVRLKGFYTDLSGWSGNKDYIPAEVPNLADHRGQRKRTFAIGKSPFTHRFSSEKLNFRGKVMFEFIIKRGEFPNEQQEYVTADFNEADDGKVYLVDEDGVFPPSWVFGEEINEEETPVHIFDDRVKVSSHNAVAAAKIGTYRERDRRNALSEIDRFCEDDDRFQGEIKTDSGFHLRFLAEIRICGKWVVGRDQKGNLLSPYPVAVWGAGPIGEGQYLYYADTESAYLREIFKAEDAERLESEVF